MISNNINSNRIVLVSLCKRISIIRIRIKVIINIIKIMIIVTI